MTKHPIHPYTEKPLYPGEELRLYTFTNFYLSGLQHGVQTGHAAVDMVVKYYDSTLKTLVGVQRAELALRWARAYKTFIILNGGNLEMLEDKMAVVAESGFPWITFHEDKASLGGILTAVGVVLPGSVFAARRPEKVECEFYGISRDDHYLYHGEGAPAILYRADHFAYPIIDLVRSCRLAAS